MATVTNTQSLTASVADLLDVKAKINVLNEQKKQLEAMIKAAIGCGNISTLENGTKVTVGFPSTTSKLDSNALKRRHPDIYNKFLREYATASRLTITPAKTVKEATDGA